MSRQPVDLTTPRSPADVSDAPLPLSAPRGGFRLPRVQEAGLIVVIVLLGLLLTFAGGDIKIRGNVVNNFFRPDNLLANVATPMSWMAIMAIGVTCVIIAGGIDISVGSIFGLAALGCAAALQNLPPDAPAWKVLPIGVGVPVAIGLACGLINGLIVVGLRMHPFIVTLGTMSIFRGIALVSVKVGSLPSSGQALPDAFTTDFMMWNIKYARASGLPLNLQPGPLLVMLLVGVVGAIYLSLSVAGRENYAVGGNEEAARFSGLPVKRIQLRVYALSGLCAGIAGMISCSYFGSAATNTGEGYELMVIAAAVVGGASLQGGRGTALGAVLGAMVIQLIENGIFILKKIDLGLFTVSLSKEYSRIIIGVAIILAVAVDRLSEYLRNRRLAGAGKR